MPNDELHRSQSPQEAQSISSNAADWGMQFIKHLRLEYTDLVSGLSTDATWPDFQQAMMLAVARVFDESGAIPEDIARLWGEIADCLSPVEADAEWNREKNARRFLLIDKRIQGTITPEESFELTQLTRQMRVHCDSEAMLPLEGARRLHQRLLDMDKSRETPG